MDDSSLDVVQVCVVFQGALQKAGLFTQLGNVCTVVVCEHLVAKDGVGNLKNGKSQYG